MSAPLWENVRRALARLFANTDVRHIPLARITPAPVIRHPQEIGNAVSASGAREDNWQPLAAVLVAPALRAETGSQEADLMPRAIVVEGLGGWGTQGCLVKAEPLHSAAALVNNGGGAHWKLNTALRVRDAPLTVREPACRVARMLSGKLRVAQIRRELWSGKAAHVQSGLFPLAQIPLTRLRLAVPETMNKALAAGRRQLSIASGVPLEDLILMGLYPDIPVAAVNRLAVEDSGRVLRFWLKPEALTTLISQRRVTLVIGRRRSSGQIVQMVL